ncbi:glycosyltransferase family 4 protein [Coraliomargarita sp. SDUM461003]|uniref:Glycosyltransferase family 4 protein n=1 Tax=Thalassobacterium maritimum TaxID=3041265 RepID=A0ABU1AWK7_9BACT|nr:glycosyltransferase family 4 protein [Coraliomargarita sp. SDUM461003]MDQ8208538.1 glycosyltransferase family 4 protein [Coraliomargarita sp. SDUM461003]
MERIAIASTGLGHVSRGIETWALDTAQALYHRGVNVTLFGAFGQKLPLECEGVPCLSVDCLRRGDETNSAWLKRLPRFIWRLGITGSYGLEQFSFWWRLWPLLRAGKYTILHVQDPMLAMWCHRFRKLGLVKTKEILAHGTEESAEFLKPFEYLQHLAPWHLEETVKRLGLSEKPRGWCALPNFVDVDTFCPVAANTGRLQQREDLRAQLGIPSDSPVFLCVAAVKVFHKRIDFLIKEFADYAANEATAHLIIAGARDRETDALLELSESIGQGRIHILLNQDRADMPVLLNTADCFVLASLFEMMPIAILEALSAGLPVIANTHPVLEWMVGPGGRCVEIEQAGSLSAALASIDTEWMRAKGALARAHALSLYSTDAVIESYLNYYREVVDV